MISNRRGVTRAAGLALVTVLALLAVVLILFKFRNEKAGPGVAAVPLTGPQTKLPASKPILVGAADVKPAAGVDRDFEIQVVDAVSKEPIPRAELAINFYVNGDPKLPPGVYTRREITENKGRAWLILPEKDPSYLEIRAKVDGYVSRRITFRDERLPTSYQFQLELGTSIGGVVNDEQGNPIVGVDVACVLRGDTTAGRDRGDLWESAKGRSDEQGRWRCDGIQQDLKEVKVKVKHGDFVSELENDFASNLPMEDLRAIKGVIVMKRGIAVTGLVMDESGEAISGASVRAGAAYSDSSMKVTTDREGRFLLKNSRPGSMSLTATARGFAPDLKAVKVSREMSALEFRLAKGNTIRGKIVDVNGKPVGGVMVAVSPFSGLQWMTKSKADGTFAWAEAPPDELNFEITKEGYCYVRQFRMSASEKEYLITLLPPQKWHGSVVDGETGKPMKSFLLVPGRQDEKMPLLWERYSAKQGRDGQYEMVIEQLAAARMLSVEAEGYLPAISPAYKMDQSDVVFDVKLKKGTGPSGIVRGPDGKPAAGVDVALVAAAMGFSVRNGEFVSNGGAKAPTIKTGADGSFQFAPQVDASLLLAGGEAGYAEIPIEHLAAPWDVKLLPWGRVVGKVKKGSKPWGDQTVILYDNPMYDAKKPQINLQYETRSDAEGNFVFERVVPREMWMSRQWFLPKTERNSAYANSPPEKIEVRPGETLTVQVGGRGRPVIGKVILPKDPASQKWSLRGSLQSRVPWAVFPESYDEWTQAQIQEWRRKFQDSDELKALQMKQKHYELAFEEDGSFRVEDAAPGDYLVQIIASDPARQTMRVAGIAQLDVTIGDIAGGQTDEPLDLGPIEFRPTGSNKPGADLSKVVFKTIDGPAVKLADYQGKAVMIHVWSSRYTKPGELGVLREIYEQYGKDGRLVMIGVCTNSRPVTAKAFAQSNGMNWVPAYVGMNSTAIEDLGYPDDPMHLLIGADGKLIGNVTKVEDLKREVEKTVGKTAP